MSLARRSLQVVAFVCTLIVGVASMAVIVTQTTWFKEWLRGFIVGQAEDYVNGQLSIGRLDGNLFFGVELEDVGVRMNGKEVVAIKDVGIGYNLFAFFGGDVVLDDIRLNQPVFRLERTGEGWNLAQIVKARTPDPDEPRSRRAIEIGEIGVRDGTLYFESQALGTTGIDVPSRIESLDASVGVKSNADELTVTVAHVSMQAVDPAFRVRALSGIVRRTANEVFLENVWLRTEASSLQVSGTVGNIEGASPVVRLSASSERLAIEEIAALVPALRGYALQPGFEITASGPAERLTVDVTLRESSLGTATGDLTIDAVEPGRRVAGTVLLEHFNIGALVPVNGGPARPPLRTGAGAITVARRGGPSSPPASSASTVARGGGPSGQRALQSDITGEARFDLALPTGRRPLSGTYQLNARDVQVAGYEARDVVASGRIDGETIRVGVRAAAYGGRATAAGTVRTGAPLALDLAGRATDVDLRNLPASLDVPRVASDLGLAYELKGRGGRFSGEVTLDRSTLAGATIEPGTTATFGVGQGAPQYAARGQVRDLDLQQVGQGFNITVLAGDRYSSRVNASFDVSGSGGGARYPLALDAAGTVIDSEVFGARFPRMDFTAHLSDGDARIRTNGRVANLNPAVVSGNERMTGSVTGTVDVETTLRGYDNGVSVDSIDVAGRIGLEESTVGDLAIDTAFVDGRYANREGDLTRLEITGADVNATGMGHIALTDTGSSNLVLHLDTPSLDRVGTIVGQPLKGSANVDAIVTGNARSLEVAGTLKGSDIGHGEHEALSIASDFTATIPDLTPADATVKAKTMATFLEVGGQKITELTTDVTYRQSTLDFTAAAQEGVRELDAGGTVIFHPDHQEIHLPNLALRAEDIEWRTPPGSMAAVQYSKDRVSIENLQLVNADQHITANGVLGSTSEPLQVRVENVDVAQVDRLLLGDQRLAGRFSADAAVTGPVSDPRVTATFALNQGAFRTFTFDSFGGAIAYAKQDGIELDVRLQQNAAEWLTAKGHAPITLFQPTPPELRGAHHPSAPGDEVEIAVASSQIGLGVIQGFTSYVTNVTGAMEAHLTVTGSGYDPHLSGAIDIRGGSFAVPDLGTAYTGLDTRIDLTPDGLSIQQFKVVDGHGSPLTIGGTLAVHARSVGAVDITLTSEQFEVIDNTLAQLRLNTDVKVTGEVRKPRIEGTLEIESGSIDVAELLETVTANPYATEAATLPGGAPPPVEAAAPPQPSIFDALAMNMNLSIPGSLVLTGSDIRTANAPVSLGDVNVTVGGSLEVRKNPEERVSLIGEISTVRGTYTFQGRRFDILRDGRIGFAGNRTNDLDPRLDLQARRVISGVETFVHVRGTMRMPELSFSSNPPLEEADILSLIVFNQPINELGEGQQISLAERAGGLASGYLTSGLARSIGGALNLDEFEIQAQGEQGFGPSLTVGEQIGRNLFVRLRQAFGAEQTTELILEYQIADFLRLQGSVAEGSGAAQRVQFRRIERAGLDLVFFFSY